MKQLLAVLLCLLLCGCAPQTAEEPENTTQPLPEKISMYDPSHPMEQAHPGAVRAYPLTLRKVRDILPFGKDVLVLSGYGSTTLTRFSGEELWKEESLTLDFELSREDPSLRVHEGFLSFFDPQARETVLADKHLTEIRRIAAPDGLSGVPLLSDDGKTLYYCTGWSVMAWDLDSGIRRTLRELTCEQQTLTGLHCSSTVLQCTFLESGIEKKLLLSAQDGSELRELPAEATLDTRDSRYFAALPAGKMTLLVFGEEAADPRLLMPRQFQNDQFYLAEDHAAVTVSDSSDGIRLDYYELNTGILRSSLLLDTLQSPGRIINCKGHSLYILTYDPASDCDILYRWDVLWQPPEAGNVTDHTSPYFTADNPDIPALEACQEYADAIGETYGITLRIWEKAAEVQPWDYRFAPEYLAPVLQRELETLEQCLAQYPGEILRQTASHYSGLTVCLVRQISGSPESGSLSTATGIQFFKDGKTYVVISTGKFTRQTLYHELYHAMESYILTRSTGLDQWENLNPAGFVYGSGQDADIYLRGPTRAFVDSYSTTYPKEDRARLFEYATMPGMEDLFRSEYMQRKLNTLCTAIRDAYRLKKSPDVLPWEQYLVTGLVPNA